MTLDPNRDLRQEAFNDDLPPTKPIISRDDVRHRWIGLTVAILLLLAAGYFFFSQTGANTRLRPDSPQAAAATTPNQRSDQ